MIINAGPEMGYSELVELYGEELGFSIGKTLRKAKSAVKSVAKPVAKAVVKTAKVVARNPAAIATGGVSLLAPKSIQKGLNSAVRITATGGASLALSKQDRNAVGKTARVVQSKVIRPVTHAVIRSPIVQKAATSAFRSFVPGGSAALDAASLVQGMKKKKPAPMLPKKMPLPAAFRPKPAPLKLKAPAQRAASGQVGQARPFRAPVVSAPAAAEAPAASSFPIIPVAIGGAGLLLVAVLAMGKKK